MNRQFLLSLSFVLIAMSLAVGCTERAPAPATPTMPADWKVKTDFLAPPGQIGPVAEKLGGEIDHVRNTVYDVNGKRVQLNTLVARNASSADKIMAALHHMKPGQFVLRDGLTIYEFVGKDDVMPDIAAGKAHLQAGTSGD